MQTEPEPTRLVRSLLDLSRHVAMADVEKLSEAVVERTRLLLDAPFAGIAATAGPDGSRPEAGDDGAGVPASILAAGDTVRSDQGPDDAPGIGPYIGAPLVSNEGIIGALWAAREPGEPPFDDEDEAVLGVIAGVAAIGVVNANLHREAVATAERMRELDDLRNEFVSLVSHELRSPMTVVVGISEILQTRSDKLSPERYEELVETLGREAKRLARLVSEVLDLEAMERGRLVLQPSTFDLGQLTAEAIADSGIADRCQLIVNAGDTELIADRDRLKQVLLNLLSNAAKFSPGSDPVSVVVTARAEELECTVTDRGPGIDAEDQTRLFERYARVGASNTKPGSGLGLYLSKAIVEQHGGRIWVDSTPGGGSTFGFVVPR